MHRSKASCVTLTLLFSSPPTLERRVFDSYSSSTDPTLGLNGVRSSYILSPHATTTALHSLCECPLSGCVGCCYALRLRGMYISSNYAHAALRACRCHRTILQVQYDGALESVSNARISRPSISWLKGYCSLSVGQFCREENQAARLNQAATEVVGASFTCTCRWKVSCSTIHMHKWYTDILLWFTCSGQLPVYITILLHVDL